MCSGAQIITWIDFICGYLKGVLDFLRIFTTVLFQSVIMEESLDTTPSGQFSFSFGEVVAKHAHKHLGGGLPEKRSAPDFTHLMETLGVNTNCKLNELCKL